VAYQLTCPCGVSIVDRDEEFPIAVNAHLEGEHPGRTYADDLIMMMAVKVPDHLLTRRRPPEA
jgi:hypothetical protein